MSNSNIRLYAILNRSDLGQNSSAYRLSIDAHLATMPNVISYSTATLVEHMNIVQITFLVAMNGIKHDNDVNMEALADALAIEFSMNISIIASDVEVIHA